ncbi:CpaF family protein [Candidatus Chloroploca sp. M-50]|uniref:Type II secretion system protein E n=2 Tax=Candidatus Chloroploca TaxID=1579476 RepID=A0A2H3KQL4_9CHLR|nr:MULTISPECIES: CpaF family protein [Candidatus Chloroploca]MBP1467587.1 CpaF family protein [Candidatus Chloroploca mongolica]PDW00709.1 type II secretion system protein E [Candidatus Chloroploca asiatica]
MSLLKRLGGNSGAPQTSEPVTARSTPLSTVAPPPPVQTPMPPPAAPVESPRGTAISTPVVQDAVQPDDQQRMLELSLWCVDRIQASLGNQSELNNSPETEKLLQERFARVYQQSGVSLPPDQVKHLFTMVCDELMGFGPIQQLLNDDSISEVMVNGPHRVYVEQKGKVKLTSVNFASEEHVLKVIDRIIRPLGRRVDRKWPMVDARLPDGSRVNAIIPPCSIDGSTVTIRKFAKNKLKIDDLIRYGSLTVEMAEFLRACVVSRLNIVVSGGTGSGKTTLLNVLSNFIPEDERIVTIEDSAELQLAQDHVVRLEAKPAEVDGSGRVQIRDLVINSLRMRPERVVIGECRGGETLDMLQAMNTGHDGSLTTLHANAPRDALARMETMSMMAGMDLPLRVIREQIASAIDIIVQQTRLDDGQRKISYITEVQGMEGDTVVLQDIFKLEMLGKSPEGKIETEMRPTGVRPRFTPRLEAHGFKLPPSIFGAQIPGQKRR